MKKTSFIYLFIIILIYFGLQYITSYKRSPHIIKIDDISLKIPNMHVQTIFGGIETENKTFIDLLFGKNPYEINYPEREMINILLTDGANSVAISLIPTLTTKQNLYSYSESNETREFQNCIISTSNSSSGDYIVDKTNNRGYAVSSDNNLTNMLIIKQICEAK